MRDVAVKNCREFYLNREFCFVVKEIFLKLWM